MNIDNIKSAIREYSRTNLYRVRFGNQATVSKISTKGFENIQSALKTFFSTDNYSVDDMVDVATKTVTVPEIGLQESNFQWKGHILPSSTAPNYGNFEATFYCDDDKLIYTYFIKWLKDIVNSDGIGLPEQNIKTNCTIYLLKNDLSVDNSFKINLYNVYPQQVGQLSLSDEEQLLEFNVSFKFTKMEMDLNNENSHKKSLLEKLESNISSLF